MQVSRALRAQILDDPIFWIALYVDWGDPSGLYKSRIAVNKGVVATHIEKVKMRSLNIHFALPCRGKAASLADRLWAQLLQQPAKWRTFLVSANNTCRENERCIHSMVQGDFLRNAPRIENFAATKKEGEYLGCGIMHPLVKIALKKSMRSVRVQVPATITAWRRNNLKVLDLRTNEDTTDWSSFFSTCGQLEELTWRRRAHMRATVIITLPKLQVFTTYTTNVLPPINAPNLSSLSVLDSAFSFTSSHFDGLVGVACVTPHMQHLDFLLNPIRNADVMEIFQRCPNLCTFAASTHENRTALYGAIAARGRTQHLLYGPRIFEEAKFSHGPPMNSHGEAARRKYEGLTRVAFRVAGNTVHFEPRAQRMVVSRFSAGFNFGGAGETALIKENGMDVQKTRVYNQSFDPMSLRSQSGRSDIVLIILSTDVRGVEAVLHRGWFFKGKRYSVFRDRPGRA
ncbi:hypothetical protein R3P38DRAFT_3232324 [Favolaschia claudopus]|uniref:Uncharacterized protein n=1 Tax=Favolaschia claudopus TaxID=2862362 RepID=A0AAV9ZIT2_9AGAR